MAVGSDSEVKDALGAVEEGSEGEELRGRDSGPDGLRHH